MSINIFKLEEYLARYEFSAKYLLCCSDAESFAMSEILDMASDTEKEMWEGLRLGYTEAPGLPILRKTIAESLYHFQIQCAGSIPLLSVNIYCLFVN